MLNINTMSLSYLQKILPWSRHPISLGWELTHVGYKEISPPQRMTAGLNVLHIRGQYPGLMQVLVMAGLMAALFALVVLLPWVPCCYCYT